jgi:hypothetical protein
MWPSQKELFNQPWGFYNLSTRVGYADRIVGTELDALNQLPYLAS